MLIIHFGSEQFLSEKPADIYEWVKEKYMFIPHKEAHLA